MERKAVMPMFMTLALGLGLFLVGCELPWDDDEADVAGTSTIQGQITSFSDDGVEISLSPIEYKENILIRIASSISDVLVASAYAGVTEGIKVIIEGPVTREMVCGEDGIFVFSGLSAGEYKLRFKYNDKEIRYRGNSGQEAVITVQENQRVELAAIKVSGGVVNIGNIKTVQLAPADVLGSDPDAANNHLVSGGYAQRVSNYKERYSKSGEWENWMLANEARYGGAVAASKSRPSTITISFRYESSPLNYSPAWDNEGQHMAALVKMAEGGYPGYSFKFVFGSAGGAYANVIAGTESTTSYASGNSIHLYYETIFNHEFAHVMRIPHHYDSVGGIGGGSSMPPGESKCLMDRNSTVFCSACKTALDLSLNVNNEASVEAAIADILSRYPPASSRNTTDTSTDDSSSSSSGGSSDDDDSGSGWIYGLKPVE